VFDLKVVVVEVLNGKDGKVEEFDQDRYLHY